MRATNHSALLALTALLGWTGCGSPDPTCAATETPYDFCADEQIWTCPRGSEQALADKAALEATCDEAVDSFACLIELEFEMFPAELKSDCGEAGQVCMPANEELATGATCEDP